MRAINSSWRRRLGVGRDHDSQPAALSFSRVGSQQFERRCIGPVQPGQARRWPRRYCRSGGGHLLVLAEAFVNGGERSRDRVGAVERLSRVVRRSRRGVRWSFSRRLCRIPLTCGRRWIQLARSAEASACACSSAECLQSRSGDRSAPCSGFRPSGQSIHPFHSPLSFSGSVQILWGPVSFWSTPPSNFITTCDTQ